MLYRIDGVSYLVTMSVNIYAVSDRRSIVLGHVVSCCCVSDSDIAAVMLQLCLLLLLIAVTGYRVGRYKCNIN